MLKKFTLYQWIQTFIEVSSGLSDMITKIIVSYVTFIRSELLKDFPFIFAFLFLRIVWYIEGKSSLTLLVKISWWTAGRLMSDNSLMFMFRISVYRVSRASWFSFWVGMESKACLTDPRSKNSSDSEVWVDVASEASSRLNIERTEIKVVGTVFVIIHKSA